MDYLSWASLLKLLSRSIKYAAEFDASQPVDDAGHLRFPARIVRDAPREQPLVSVIIPTYNWSSALRLAIGSILWQIEQNFEILVMGDACTDDSEAVVRSFGDARIHWHNLSINSGSQSAPNNAGLALARGRYVAYLGHDDVWHPAHLRWMTAAMEGGADLASSLVEMIGPQGTNYRVVTGVYPWRGYNGKRGLPPSGLMHRREITSRIGGWKDYRETWRNPDADFVFRAFEAGCRFVSAGELTVFKFNSALRKNSYVEKPIQEQMDYLRRIRGNRWFMREEALRIANVHLRRIPMTAPVHPPPPDPHTPGWQVSQYRKFRGLE